MTTKSWIAVVVLLLIIGAGVYEIKNSYKKENVASQPSISVATPDTQRRPIDPKQVKVGDTVGPWVVSKIIPVGYDSMGTPISGDVDFTGDSILHGSISDNPYLGLMFNVSVNDQAKIPVSVFNSKDTGFVLEDPSHQLYDTSGELTSLGKSLLHKEIEIEVTQFHLPFGAGNPSTAQLVRIVK